jgi:hypothetical protein
LSKVVEICGCLKTFGNLSNPRDDVTPRFQSISVAEEEQRLTVQEFLPVAGTFAVCA